MKRILVFSCLLALLGGCSRQSDPSLLGAQGSGNIVPLIIQCATNRGGRPTTNATPSVQANWTHQTRGLQEVILIDGDHFTEIQKCLEQAYGAPNTKLGSAMIAPVGNGRALTYSAQQLGVVLNVTADPKQTIVSIMGQLVVFPEVVGSERFTNQVYQALLLLRQRDPDAYAIVANYIGRIKQGEHSGMRAYDKPSTFEMSGSTAYYSVTWCAAVIAHDSFHSKLYHDQLNASPGPVPDAIWTGRAAEKKCMKHQLGVMEHIGTGKWELDWAKTQSDGHYVKDNEAWEDYQKKDW